ncbi:MAG: hypothetical protein O7A03_04320 [Alphaproteobacteria bacterium]|nr:hypothetical protein [Alphaproteobacteria bacterium]
MMRKAPARVNRNVISSVGLSSGACGFCLFGDIDAFKSAQGKASVFNCLADGLLRGRDRLEKFDLVEVRVIGHGDDNRVFFKVDFDAIDTLDPKEFFLYSEGAERTLETVDFDSVGQGLSRRVEREH